MTDGSSGILDTKNIHHSKSSDSITCSINDQMLAILRCLKRLINAKFSKSPDFQLQARNNVCRLLESDIHWILHVFSNSMLLLFSSGDFTFRAVPEPILNSMRK